MDKEENNYDFKLFDKELIGLIITTIIAMTVFDGMNLFFNLSMSGKYYTVSGSLRFSILMSIIVYTFFMAIFKKASKATITCCIITFLMNLLIRIKFMFTGEMLYFSDINFLNHIGNLVGMISNNISPIIYFKLFIIFTFYALILAGICYLNHKYNIEIKSKKLRISIIVVDILLLLVLFIPNGYTKDFYLKVFFDTDNYLDYDSYGTNYQYYLMHGMINGMYGNLLNNRFSEPKDYNEEEMLNILQKNEDTSNTKLGKPNIIVLFAESFFDVDQIEEVKFDKKITSNFNRLKNEGKFINLISPTYGGMSENVAFELFTGGSMNYFPKGYIPVMSLYSRKRQNENTSIVKVLNDNGYDSKIVFGRDYYDSEDALTKMGFKEYVELDKTMDIEEFTDEFAINLIIDELKNKKENERLFYAIETYESHFPYIEEKYDSYDIAILESDLDEKEQTSLRAYTQAIYHMDEQLNRLYTYIQEYDEPTMIVFLGDHLPYLFTPDNVNVISKLEYFNTDDELLNYYRKYNTQCLLLANYDISDVEVPEYSGIDLIFANLINQMDISNINYYKWLNSTKNILVASNRYISLDKDGNKYYTNELTGKMKEIYDLKNKMQYMFFIK